MSHFKGNDGLFNGDNENSDMPNIIGKGYNNNNGNSSYIDPGYMQEVYDKNNSGDYINPEVTFKNTTTVMYWCLSVVGSRE